MSFMSFKASFDRSHRGPSHPFEDVGVAEDSLTGIHNAMMKNLFAVNRSCRHWGFLFVSPQVEIYRI
jgi:hypothetical protein